MSIKVTSSYVLKFLFEFNLFNMNIFLQYLNKNLTLILYNNIILLFGMFLFLFYFIITIFLDYHEDLRDTNFFIKLKIILI